MFILLNTELSSDFDHKTSVTLCNYVAVWSFKTLASSISLMNINTFLFFFTINWLGIFFPENGDDNLVLGLCIDSVSVYEKVNVQLGVEERTELTPYCVLICLTLDGKLVMFNVARYPFFSCTSIFGNIWLMTLTGNRSCILAVPVLWEILYFAHVILIAQ